MTARQYLVHYIISYNVLNSHQGATIPQCGSGTNILISLPGSVSSEDMAVTGAGARLNGADASTLSLLYDFEELEGELDFLTRVVTLTFYPAASGRTPLTLGEVQRHFAGRYVLLCAPLNDCEW